MATTGEIERLPRSMQIGPFRYQIGTDAEAAYDYGYLGVTLNRSRRVKLDPRQSDTEMPQTFLHEALHAIGDVYEIEMIRRHTIDNNGNVTDKIDLAASALLQFLRSNPGVVAYLIGGDE